MTAIDMHEPTTRALVLSETLKYASQAVGPFNYCTMFNIVQDAIGIQEESCSYEITSALSIFIRRGLLECNTYDEAADSILYGVDTWLRASKDLTRFVWADEVCHVVIDDDEEGEES